jgi:glycosyltransferase involved in cell wall biosynthesis
MLAMANHLMTKGHQVICLLSESFQDGKAELLADIYKHAPGVRLTSFRIPSPCAAHDERNVWRQMAARIIREHAIACFEPDFVHVPALLADGWGDDAVGSIDELGIHVPVSLTQHDLIPLAMQEIYMPPGRFYDYYMKKLEGVKKADLFLAISEYSRKEVINLLGVDAEKVVHISSAADAMFLQRHPTNDDVASTIARYQLKIGFLLYVPGGFDPRKNLERLIRAYATLPQSMRSAHPLVIGSQLDPGRRDVLESCAVEAGLSSNEFILTDYVPDQDLMCLYRACHAYVFPSLHEGFGLPVLEAMACAAPVIASDCTSIPEVVGMVEALFDPLCEESMAKKMRQVIEDVPFRQRLLDHAVQQIAQFSWEKTAEMAVAAIETRHNELRQNGWRPSLRDNLPSCDHLLKKLADMNMNIEPSEKDISEFRECYRANFEMAQA